MIGRRAGAVGVTMLLRSGEDLVLTPAGAGPVYLAVSGWNPRRTLGSCSVDTFSRIGGVPVSVGDRLEGDVDRLPRDRIGWFHRAVNEPSGPVRLVLSGGEASATFLGRRWRVERTARSGVRLTSEGWQGPRASINSFPVLPGAVQLTPDGEAIVLGPDGALTGGYPVVGVVATVDLDRLSTLQAGTGVSFMAVDPEAATKAWADASAARARSVVHPALLS
jgi:allophanate hydrolase subunit 2